MSGHEEGSANAADREERFNNMAVMEVTFASSSLKRAVTFSAVLPVDWRFGPGQAADFEAGKFKTLYLLHGYTGTHNDFLLNSDIAMLSAQNNLAVIFPSGENSFYLEDEDLGVSHSQLVGKELVEFTRALFPLSPKREDTFIAGISMGGYGAMINGLRYADTFGKIQALSGAFINIEIADAKQTKPDGLSSSAYQRRVFGDPATLRQTDRDPRYLLEQLVQRGAPIPQISQCCGAEDFLIGPNRKLHQFMVDAGISHLYEEGHGEHNWDYWLPKPRSGVEWMVRN